MYLEGTSKVLDFPEFRKFETTKNFLSVLETKEVVRDLLDNGFASDINVYIGDEAGVEGFKDFSMITFKHMVEGKELRYNRYNRSNTYGLFKSYIGNEIH